MFAINLGCAAKQTRALFSREVAWLFVQWLAWEWGKIVLQTDAGLFLIETARHRPMSYSNFEQPNFIRLP
jgi:hypothetical protein